MTNMEISVPGIAMAEENTSDEAPKLQNNRRPRTSEDFYLFCTYVLQYENYESEDKEDVRTASNQSPPLDSSGSSVNSESTNSGHDDKPSGAEDSDTDSFDLITCYCGKPFAGRPMIECSICLTWIHLSCARIKKSNIPDVFHCAMCKSSNTKKQRSASPTNPPDKGIKRPKRTTRQQGMNQKTVLINVPKILGLLRASNEVRPRAIVFLK